MAKNKLIIDVRWDEKLYANIVISAAKASADIMAVSMQDKIKRDADISVHEDKGGVLTDLLEASGLAQYTISGALEKGFNSMIAGIIPNIILYNQ